MTFAGKQFNEVSDYVKKMEGTMQAGQAKMLAKKSCSVGNFSGFTLRGTVSRPI